MPPWALGKDICEGASTVDGKMEAPLRATHGDGAGVQQRLLSWQSWENWPEAVGHPQAGSPEQSWDGERTGFRAQKGPWVEPELGKSGLGLMPPVPTPQFQCPGLRRKPRASWSRTFRG